MVIIPNHQPEIQTISPDWYQGKVTEVAMLRLDTVHPEVSGNKWYKLKHNIDYCLRQGIDRVLTFGGAYSNHLVATAAAAQLAGLKSIGIVRGTYAQEQITPTLQACVVHSMELHFVSIEDYKLKDDPETLKHLSERYSNTFIIPEGGANEQGRAGAGEIAALIPERFTHVAVSVGTGTTLIGLANHLPTKTIISGYAPMKGGSYLNAEVAKYIDDNKKASVHIYDTWHFGGFGKHNDELISFMNDFYNSQAIPLDVVYTAKMMYGLREQLLGGIYSTDARILCIHTGGLQGNTSLGSKLVY